MTIKHITTLCPTIVLTGAAAIAVPTQMHAEVMTQTNPVAYEFDIPGAFNLERVGINFDPFPERNSTFRFDPDDIVEYWIGTAPYTADIGIGYHHQFNQFGSYAISSSLRNESDTARVEFAISPGTLYVTATYYNGEVAVDSMFINDNAGTTYDGALFSPPTPGDINLDGIVDGLDIDPFVTLLSGGGFQAEADINEDGFIDGLDIDPFVSILSGTPASQSGPTTVPEPTSAFATAVLLGLGLIPRRRRA